MSSMLLEGRDADWQHWLCHAIFAASQFTFPQGLSLHAAQTLISRHPCVTKPRTDIKTSGTCSVYKL